MSLTIEYIGGWIHPREKLTKICEKNRVNVWKICFVLIQKAIFIWVRRFHQILNNVQFHIMMRYIFNFYSF